LSAGVRDPRTKCLSPCPAGWQVYRMSEQRIMPIETIEYYFGIRRYDQVVEFVKDAFGEQAENARLWYMLGFSNYQLDLYDEAEEQLMEAIRLGMEETVVLPILGHLYMETNRFQKAEEAFLDTLRQNPNDAQTHASYAYLMKKTGYRKKAKLLMNKALELDPENAHVLRYYLRLEGLNHKKNQEILALEQYMNSADSELSKLIVLGVHASLHKKVKEAREYFRQAFLLQPEDKKLLSILEELDIQGHPLLAPNRLVDRLGGPAVFWAIGIGMLLILHWFGQDLAGAIWLYGYVGLALYTWISLPLIKMIRKMKRR